MTLPSWWLEVLRPLRPVFRRSSTFGLFVLLATGLVARTRRRTVVGMLTGAGMATVVSFHAACRFFSADRWEVDRLGLAVARLVVDRLVADSPITVAVDDTAKDGQDPLFTTWRHHGFITNSTLTTVAADETHRDHAIVEQVIAELKQGPMAHAPSGKFNANAAWLALACIAFNLLRAAGAAASPRHATARWATLRTHLIAVPARIANSARRIVLHLPKHWPWAAAWQDLWAAATTP